MIPSRHRNASTCPRLLAMATTVTEDVGETVGKRTNQLLDRLAFWKNKHLDEEQEIFEAAKGGPGEKKAWMTIFQKADRKIPDEPLDAGEKVVDTVEKGFGRWMKFWKRREKDVKKELKETQKSLEGVGEAVRKGDVDAVTDKVRSVNLGWLQDELHGVEREAMALGRYVVDHFFPWDYDRNNFGVTFWHIWKDMDTKLSDDMNNVVKMTSTIKPVVKEWKLTARTRLLPLGKDGVIFGKAGLYIVGDQPPYYGVEADKVWALPRLRATSLFTNANFRSSRKPETETIRGSVGLQHTVKIRDSLDFTFRVGVTNDRKLYFTPIPFGSYF